MEYLIHNSHWIYCARCGKEHLVTLMAQPAVKFWPDYFTATKGVTGELSYPLFSRAHNPLVEPDLIQELQDNGDGCGAEGPLSH